MSSFCLTVVTFAGVIGAAVDATLEAPLEAVVSIQVNTGLLARGVLFARHGFGISVFADHVGLEPGFSAPRFIDHFVRINIHNRDEININESVQRTFFLVVQIFESVKHDRHQS